MNASNFAEWLRRQGHRVVRTQSTYWHDQGPRVYQAFPYHWLIDPSEEELGRFLRQHRGIALRYSTPVEAKEGQLSYHAVYDEGPYELELLSKWSRKNVRRGLRNCSVTRISFERLATEGWALQRDTLDRQGRDVEIDQEVWRNRCLSAGDLSGFTAWGALVEGRLAASVITFQMSDCVYMLYQQCHSECLREHVNNALSFVVTQAELNDPAVKSILYGLHSLDAPASVDVFKFRMGYRPKEVRQRVVCHPWLKPFFNHGSHAVLGWLARKQPHKPTITKAEGMLRFYLEGKKPLAQQQAPEALQE